MTKTIEDDEECECPACKIKDILREAHRVPDAENENMVSLTDALATIGNVAAELLTGIPEHLRKLWLQTLFLRVSEMEVENSQEEEKEKGIDQLN